MSSPVPLTQHSVSPPPESSPPARSDERLPPDITPDKIHAVLRDIVRRDPDLWTRVQQDKALWQAFGFETETSDTELRPGRLAAG